MQATTIRLHQDDDVLIARSTLMENVEVSPGVRTRTRIPAGHKVAIKPLAVGAPIHRYGQIIGFATAAHRPRRASPRPQLRHGRFRQRLRLHRRRPPHRHGQRAAHLPGHPPPGRPRRHPQLHRHPDLGELQRPHRRPRRRPVQAQPDHRPRPPGSRLPQRRRRRRPHPQDRVRHDRRRAPPPPPPHPRRLCPAT